MGFVSSSDGCQIYYETHGSANPVIVFVSGYFPIADIWRPLAARLSPQYRCISHDNRGFGRSSKPENREAYSVEKHAQDITALLDSLQIHQPVILVTHSMGGNIASAFTLANPARVAGIVYTGTYYDGKQFGDPEASYKMLTANADVPTEMVKFYINFGLTEDIAIEAAKWSPLSKRHNGHAVVEFEMGGRYADIKVPTMVVQGSRDVVNPPEFVKPLVDALPQCRLEIVDGVNHFPPTEAPEMVERLVREFITALKVGGGILSV